MKRGYGLVAKLHLTTAREIVGVDITERPVEDNRPQMARSAKGAKHDEAGEVTPISEHIQRLVERGNEEQYPPGSFVEPPAHEVSGHRVDAARKIAGLFGKGIVWFRDKADTGTDGLADPFDQNRIFLNIYSDRIPSWAAGHALWPGKVGLTSGV